GHVAGLGVVWRALADGVPVVIVPSGDPGALLAALGAPVGHDAAGRAPSHVSLVPGQLLRLLEATGDAAPPPSVLAVPLGGGAIPPALVVRALEAGWPIVSTYGLSEMGSGVTALPTAEAAQAPKTAGRPLPGLSITIDDPDRSGIGEITVSGPSRCSGYLGEPPVPATEPLRTGDLGRLDAAGRLVVVDRRTDRIVRGGENIDPSEVETVLEAHPAIAEACVVGRPDERWGSVPVAAMVLQPGAVNPPDDELTAHVRARLAGFKVPIAFARLDTLPRTASGKLRREAVRPFLAAERSGTLARPGGDAIGWRVTGDGPTQVLLLHGTVSSAAQLDRLATALAAALGATVHAIDRRGHGTSTLGDPTAIDAGTHVDDVVAYLDARGIGRIVVIGHSFGGVIGLELGARHRDRVRAIAAYEPPYGLLAEGEWRAWFERVATDTAAAHAAAGAAQASETFLRMVAGDAAWDRLPERARDFLRAQGDGALADSGLRGLDPDGLRRIAAPTLLLTGAASEPFYAPIADTLAARIHGARRATLAGATHTTPITDPAPVVAAIRDLLELPA
ncbi:MAG: alpha/beta fold hydrolase, partial [Chloroflexota bacterium]